MVVLSPISGVFAESGIFNTLIVKDSFAYTFDHITYQSISVANEMRASGLLTLVLPEDSGCFIHAYRGTLNDTTVALHMNDSSSPLWKLGLKSNPNNKEKDLIYRSVKGDLLVEYNYFKPTFKVNDKDLGMEVVKDNLDDTQIPMNDVMINKLYAKLHSTGRTPSTEVDTDDDNKTAHELIIEWNNYLSEWINDDDMLAECNSDIEFKKEYARLQVHINQMNTEMLRVSNEDSKVEGIKINPKALEKSA